MNWSQDQQIGPFRLVRPLGRGGFADVWLAERKGAGEFRRQLALKLVAVGDSDGELLRSDSLLREARLCSWLNNPHVVQVEGVEEADGIVWMAMEYCDGGSLTQLIRRMLRLGLAMPPAVAVRIGRDVARALGAAHHAKTPDGAALCVVHRDLKPGNVLLTRAGSVKVCDFGIAKATDETNVTGTNMLKGTASYIAPEIWDDVRAFSPASDAFALGTLLLEILVLDRLHAGGSMPQVYRRIVQGTAAEDASRVAAHLPPIVPLLEQLLQRDPSKRASDLRHTALELDLLLGTLPGPDDPALLLAMLDSIEKGVPMPPLPERVDLAWQAVIERATGEQHPLVDGPTGGERAWPLAVPVAPEATPAPRGPEPESLSLDLGQGGAANLDATAPWQAPPARQAPAAAGATSSVEQGRTTQPWTPALTTSPEEPAAPAVLAPSRRSSSHSAVGGSSATMKRRRSPARRRKQARRPTWLVPVLLLAALGLASVLVVLLGGETQRVVERAAPVETSLAVAPEPAPVEPDPEVERTPSIDPQAPPPSPVAVQARPVPKVAARAAAPERPAARPEPIPAPSEPRPEPTNEPRPEPAALEAVEEEASPVVADRPCVLVASRPTGAYVWLDAAAQPLRATSRLTRLPRVRAGTLRVGMALVADAPTAGVQLTLKDGDAVEVRCDLLGEARCVTASVDPRHCAP